MESDTHTVDASNEGGIRVGSYSEGRRSSPDEHEHIHMKPITDPNHLHHLYNNIHASTLNQSTSRNKDHDDNSSSSWPTDVDIILERIRCNSIILSDYHKQNYFYLHSRLKYFRIPVIIISAFASVFNIGLQPFMDQGWISIICCLMSLVTGLIGSIELFLQIQKRMESDLTYSRDYYLLAIDIYKVLSLDPKNRNGDGGTFLDDKFNIYRKMVENSNILDKKIIDQLAPIDTRLTRSHEVGSGGESSQPPTPTAGKSTDAESSIGLKTDSMDVHDHIHHKKHDKDMNNFHSYFRKPNQDNHETESIDTEDRFQIYCDLVQKSDYIEKGVLEKLTPILISHRKNQEYNLSMEDRMKLFCYFLDNADKFNQSNGFIDKMKPILMSDFFRSVEPTSNTNIGIEDKFKLYQTISEHRNILNDSALDKIKHVLMNDIKTNSTKKKDSAGSWIQSFGNMLRSKSIDSDQCPRQASLAPDTVTQDYQAKPVRLGLQSNTKKIDKDVHNDAPIHNLYDTNVMNVFEQNQIDNIRVGTKGEQSSSGASLNSQVFTTKVNDISSRGVNNIMGILKPLREVSNIQKKSNISKNLPIVNRQKPSQLYSINIPKNRPDEISFIQGNSEV